MVSQDKPMVSQDKPMVSQDKPMVNQADQPVAQNNPTHTPWRSKNRHYGTELTRKNTEDNTDDDIGF
jgi:hypothetical protein